MKIKKIQNKIPKRLRKYPPNSIVRCHSCEALHEPNGFFIKGYFLCQKCAK